MKKRKKDGCVCEYDPNKRIYRADQKRRKSKSRLKRELKKPVFTYHHKERKIWWHVDAHKVIA